MSDVSVKFGAVDSGLSETIIKIKGSLSNLESQTAKTSSSIGSGFKGLAMSGAVMGGAIGLAMGAVKVATAAASAVVNDFGAALDMGGRLADLSVRTGETAGNLTILERAFTNNGLQAENVGTSVNKLQKFMAGASEEGSKQAEIMGKLGMTMADLNGKTPTQQMEAFAVKIAGVSDPTQRAAVAMEIFGKSGGAMLPVLSNFSSELATAQDQLGSLPGVMDRSAAAFDTISDNFTVIRGKVTEFAAGFIEKATPALLTFTNYLSGVDAAGWGEKMMSMVLQVADTLMGAFKNPLGAIDMLGSALMAAVKGMGNLYVNYLTTGADFLGKFFSSDLPGMLVGQLGNSMVLAFTSGLKFLVDGINSAGKALYEFFGSSIEKVGKFLADSFHSIVKFFAEDFVNAMMHPVDFMSGKLNSALETVNKNGGLSFKAAYDDANGNVLDKLSGGLGAVADMYGQRVSDGTAKIKDEFGTLVDSVTISTTDFFGAVPAAKEVVDKLKGLEDTGKTFRESLTTATDSAKKDTAPIKTNLEIGANAMTKAATKVKEAMTMSQKIADDIAKSEAKNDVSRNGKYDKQAQDAIDSGNYDKARSINKRVQEREMEQELRGVGRNRDTRSLTDMARAAGVETGLRSQADIKKDLLDLKRRGGELKPGAEGNTEADAKAGKDGKGGGAAGNKDSGTLTAIKVAAEAIQKLVQSLDKKLPQHALGA